LLVGVGIHGGGGAGANGGEAVAALLVAAWRG
jgi:hypothetical protein